MKKVLIGLGIVIALLAGLGYLFRAQLFMLVMATQIAPEGDFDPAMAPAAPDYANDDAWAALPERDDPADEMPAGVTRRGTGTAVFFVHPTSYFGKTWNQPLADEAANWVVDHRVLRHQASVFSSCCDIYAPRYRQATFFSFMDDSDNGERALTLAYNDVVSAFHNFLGRLTPGRPFVVAGHSQGSRHATRLVREEITGTELQHRLVAAYLIGFSITPGQLGDLPPCDAADQFGCAIGWNAMDGHSGGAFGGDTPLLCTNPLNWRNDGGYAGHDQNLGGIGFATYGAAEDGEDYTAMDLIPAVADAECTADGQLAIPELRSDAFPMRMMGNSMHVYDYSLFHMNVRENVAARIAAYLGARG